MHPTGFSFTDQVNLASFGDKMSETSISSQSAALQVIQQAVVILAKWAEADSWLAGSSFGDSTSKFTTEIVTKAQEILGWAKNQQLDCLQLVFDRIQLSHQQKSPHFRPAWALKAEAGAMRTPAIPYARGDRPSNDDLEN